MFNYLPNRKAGDAYSRGQNYIGHSIVLEKPLVLAEEVSINDFQKWNNGVLSVIIR
jgi:hypothetical protein